MARDYAARNKRPAPKAAGLPGWVWLVAGLSMGLVVACIVYIARPAQPMPMAPGGAVVAAQKPKPKIEIPPKEDPRFDFYTLLEDEQVVVTGERKGANKAQTPAIKPPPGAPVAPSAAVAITPVAPPAPAVPGEKYVILVGSFREVANAEQHKAKLAMAGVEARIETVSTQDHKTLHRVRIGPSNSLAQAQNTAAQLKAQGFDSRVIKLP